MKSYVSIWIIIGIIYIGYNPHRECSVKEKSQTEIDSLLYFGIRVVLNDFYIYHYQYPTEIKQLTDFIHDFVQNIELILPYEKEDAYLIADCYLKKNYGVLSFAMSDEYFYLKDRDGIKFEFTLSDMPFFYPCEIISFLGDSPTEYESYFSRFSKSRFFDMDGRAVILPEYLDSILFAKIPELQHQYLIPTTFKYESYEYEDRVVPTRVFLQYELDKGLNSFCAGKDIDFSLLYFQKLAEYLQLFCKKHDLSKIIFLSANYYGINQ